MILSYIKSVNLLVMLLLEFAVYAGAALWGFTAVDGLPASLLLGIGAPVLLIAVWARFGAPRASHPVHGGYRVLLELLWFGSGAAALAASGRPEWAAVFGMAFLVNAALRFRWGQ